MVKMLLPSTTLFRPRHLGCVCCEGVMCGRKKRRGDAGGWGDGSEVRKKTYRHATLLVIMVERSMRRSAKRMVARGFVDAKIAEGKK